MEHPADASPNPDPVLTARARLKGGRNEQCPCGSGRKYKKCCLENDEALMRDAGGAGRTEVARDLPSPPISAPKAKERRPLSEAEVKRNALWDAFDALKQPTASQMDDLLGNLLVLPPDGGTDWAEVVHAFARHNHPDLPSVFRNIAGAVPHTKGTGMAFFYWATAEEFARPKLEARSAWTRADFGLVKGDIRESDAAWQECLRLNDTLMGVAWDGWQNESFPPGCGFRGLFKVLESVYTPATKLRRNRRSRSAAIFWIT
jgi:hypothetical protein